MAQQEVTIGAVCSQSLSIVVESVDLAIRLRDPTDALAIPIVTIGILVEVVPQMDDIIDRVFARRIAVSVEEAEGEIAARIDGKADLGDEISRSRRCLGPPDRTCDLGGAADAELVVVLSVWAQTGSFDLDTILARSSRHQLQGGIKTLTV